MRRFPVNLTETEVKEIQRWAHFESMKREEICNKLHAKKPKVIMECGEYSEGHKKIDREIDEAMINWETVAILAEDFHRMLEE